MAHRSLLVTALVALSMSLSPVLPGAVGAAASPTARAAPTGLPAAPEVKAAVGGQGAWRVYPGDIAALGSRPAGCRSDEQMLAYRGVQARWYSGRERGVPRAVHTGAEIAVLRYADAAAARAAVRNNESYPRRCPRVTEWVCEECDGISTTRRTRVPVARLGDQSVAWSLRAVGNAKSAGYTVVARRGRSVVRVTLTRTRDMVADAPWRYPRSMPKREVVRLARVTLRAGP
ncbi:hypothetical protein [Nocardioides sp. 1609]|uniref:hypothetical protein n=1 Tax=Nocardioides sp. 1609 TaxID=2508327 RepID=UPI00106FA592|nr:hypothetical protein [Nocardioides sp. 1609]